VCHTRAPKGIDPYTMEAAAKRPRTAEASNPFETRTFSVIAPTDAAKLDDAYRKAVALAALAGVNVLEKLGTISSKNLKEHLHIIKHGKQNNIVKMQMIVETLPDLLSIKEAAVKFEDTHELQSKKIAGTFWKYFAEQSGGKVNMDVVRVLIKGILDGRGDRMED
jgi:hypothetical protein